MKYYCLDYTTDAKVDNGIFPQNQKFVKEYNSSVENSAYDLLMKSNEYVFTNEFNIGTLIIESEINLTDYISSAIFTNSLISNNLLNILLEFKLQKHRIFRIPITYKNNLLTYNYIYFWRYQSPAIDYLQTNFMECEILGDRLNDKLLYFSNFEDYNLARIKEYDDNGVFIKPYQITLIQSQLEFDIFEIGIGLYNTVISEKVKDALLSANLTGFDIKLLPDWIIIK